MAFGFTTYVDPGVYQQEVLVPSGINAPAQPFAVCLVGTGSRFRRVNNELVVRGIVKNEALTVTGSGSPVAYTATLANRSTRQKETTALYRTLNGVRTEMSDEYYSFLPASITGVAVTPTDPVDLVPNNAIVLEMDGKVPVTITFTYGASNSVTRVGRQLNVTGVLGTDGNDATRTQIAGLINFALASTQGGELGFGAAYANVATIVSDQVVITSPSSVSPSLSYVKVSPAFALSATALIFGPATIESNTRIQVSATIWDASATWNIDYAQAVDDTDPLAQTTGVQRIVSVGSEPSGNNFVATTDYVLNGQTVDWSPDTAAVVTGVASGTPAVSASVSSFTIQIDGAVDDTGSQEITVNVWAPDGAILGEVAGSTAIADIVANINATLNNKLGPKYMNVASAPGNVLTLTSPTQGRTGYIKVGPATTNSAFATLFPSRDSGVTTFGSGKRPVAGAGYYVTYEYTRPASDYDRPVAHFSMEAVREFVGQPSAATAGYNPLAIAAEIAFDNGAEFVYTVQVRDSVAGAPNITELRSALDGALTVAGCTEVVIVGMPGSAAAIRQVLTEGVSHLEDACSPTEKAYRRLWAGGPRALPMGDRNTTDSLIGWATNVLQVGTESPARGRMFMVAPPQAAGVSRAVTLDDGTFLSRLQVDSSYLAVACAARKISLGGPAETLTRKQIYGFNLDDVTLPWSQGERRMMASQGVMVVSFTGGILRIEDAVTTEGGRGNKVSFRVDSTSYQKDIIVKKIDAALDANVVSVVPYDLTTFIIDIKLIIQSVLASEIGSTIGPYRDKNSGETRPIDLRTDIRVAQSLNNPTEFSFSYWFNLRYPALRLLGQYSVDNPFFGLSS